jgi:thiosulfate/3-mercaptopyruvate sulfurtransferase
MIESVKTTESEKIMPGIRIVCLTIMFFCMAAAIISARDIDPFVSADWLAANIKAQDLIAIDVRSAAEYKKGHISGSFNANLDLWAVNKSSLMRELPAENDLIILMGSLGIREDSKVVVIGKGEGDFDRADAIRVAWTLLSAGVRNVSVLDGGFQKWTKDKKPSVGEPLTPTAVKFNGKINADGLASKKQLLSKIGNAIVLDARTPEVYFGIATEPWAQRPGHIRTAMNLPAPWAFSKDGFVRDPGELLAMANTVIGVGNKSKEIIVYCGAGPYATVWSYLLTELLGYKKVKVYDGSMQEWIMDPAGPVAVFGWK